MFRVLLLLLCSCVLLAGCEPGEQIAKPTTHPVTGVLLDKNGSPVTSGTIQFLAADGSAKLSTTAMVKPDGTFELQVMDIAGTKYPGAEEGIYTVKYMSAMTDDQNVQQFTLPGKFTVKAGDNNFPLKLP